VLPLIAAAVGGGGVALLARISSTPATGSPAREPVEGRDPGVRLRGVLPPGLALLGHLYDPARLLARR
jgi:hypothetical protein